MRNKDKKEKLIKIEELAVLTDVSYKTIQNWYMWKKQNPDHELAKLLPEFQQDGCRQTRYWTMADVEKIKEFKKNVPQGRNGIMGCVTQKYYKKNQES